MKGPAVILVVAVMLLSQIVPARAETEWHVTREAYGLRVGSVDLVTSANGRYTVVRQTRTTGRVAGGVQIRYEYDYEEETPECVGRFEEDAPVAFVTVDGFGEELASLHDPDRVVVTVNGERVGVPAETGLGEYIGWQNANRDGRYCVVFPILLTREGSRTEYAVRVQALLDGERVAETAHITVILQNTHEYKAERALRIAALEGENVDAYLLGDRIYLDHPATAVGEARVRVTFADENGGSMDGIAWAGQTACAQPNRSAALYLEKECRLERSSAEYLLDQGADPLRHRKATFCVETEEALYRSPEYTLVQRQDVPAEDPRGLYFAQSECVLPVGGVFRPVNRLDCGTSGLMAVARDAHVHALLCKSLHTGSFERRYLAVAEGVFAEKEGAVDAPIARAEGSAIKRCVSPDGQRAVTHYRVLRNNDRFSLVELVLETGRTHQIRVHLAHLGHPLAGDFLYGTEDKALIGRAALHAWKLRLTHPITGQILEFERGLPQDMLALTEGMTE